MERTRHRYQKIFVLAAILVFACCLCLPLQAYGGTLSYTDGSGIVWEYQIVEADQYTIRTDSVEILGCSAIPKDGILHIPAVIDGKEVVSIGGRAFDKNPDKLDIKEVAIPKHVVYVQANAFQGCRNLKKLELPESLQFIEHEAFIGCGMEELVLPDSLFRMDHAFGECDRLRRVTLPKNYYNSASINQAFRGCGAFTEFVLKDGEALYAAEDGVLYSKDRTALLAYPSGKDEATFLVSANVETIGEYAFAASKLKEIQLPDSLKTIGSGAFADCERMKRIDIPKGVEVIPFACFANSSALETVTLQEGVTEIGEYAFGNCAKLMGVDMPKTVRTIGSKAFLLDRSMTYAVVPEGVSSIEESTFGCCESLEYVNLPESLKSIGSRAFQGGGGEGSSLKTLYIPEGVETINEKAFVDSRPDLTIYSKSPAAAVFAEANDIKHVNADRKQYEEYTDSEISGKPCETHILVHHAAEKATCTATGRIEYYVCARCGKRFEDSGGKVEVFSTITEKKAHTLVHHVAKAATKTEDGNLEYWACSVCDKVFSDKDGKKETRAQDVILPKGTENTPAPTSPPAKQVIQGTSKYIRFIGSKFRLNAKAKTPLIYRSSNAKVAMVGRNGFVTVTGYGTCRITVTATATSRYRKAAKSIIVNGKLAKPCVQAVAGPRKVRLTWGKVAGADGYELYIRLQGKSKFRKALTKGAKVKGVMHRGLTKRKKYSYKIRAFKKVGKKVVYSGFSSTVTVRVK